MLASRVLSSHSPKLCELEELAGSIYGKTGQMSDQSPFSCFSSLEKPN